jgi:hypothetical protein
MVLLAGAGADAAAIHRAATHPIEMTAADVATFRQWSKYLFEGPQVWTHQLHPPVSAEVRTAIWQSVRTDPGGTDPMVSYLLWKQSLDPTRFALYHPKLAPALRRISLARSSPTLPPLAPPTMTGSTSPSPTPSTPSTVPTTSPQNLIPGATPEPSTLLLAACMTAWAVRTLRHRQGDGGA